MTIENINSLTDKIFDKGEMSADDMLALRRLTGADFKICKEEADLLFQLNDQVKTPEGWSEYFIMVMTTFLIRENKPEGYISEANAAWLRARIDHDGVVDTEVELELLLHIIRYAVNVTDSLEKFALDQVTLAVLQSDGYLGKDRKLEPGVIGEVEVSLLRRVLYGVSSEGGVGISRMEAEYLMDLNEATAGREHHSDWQKLFVYGITNYLMVQPAWEEASAEEALRLENWVEDSSTDRLPWSNAKFVLSKSFIKSEILSCFKSKNDDTFAPKHMDITARIHAETITESESNWLIERLNRDGGIDVNERALLDHLAKECPVIHQSLRPLLRAA